MYSCGSSSGTSPIHLEAARELGKAFHANNVKLVYGAGTTGIMGEVAKTLVELSGPDAVHGIIPVALLQAERKYDDKKFGPKTNVPDMHTRKKMMATEVAAGGPGSGFVALSGGYGTLDELMEMVTWNQLGIHALPVILYNVNGFFDGLLQWLDTAVGEGFVTEKNKSIMSVATNGQEVVERLRDYEPSKGRLDLQWKET